MPDFSYGNCTSIYEPKFRKTDHDEWDHEKWESVGVSWLKFDETSFLFSGFVKANNTT